MRATLFECMCALFCFFVCASVMASPQVLVDKADYIAVDYSEAVKNGAIIDQGEYVEMQTFAQQIAQMATDLKLDATMMHDIHTLEKLINDKAEPSKVVLKARDISLAVSKHYKLIHVPQTPPQPARAAALYQQHCASCHGASGRGDGVLAKTLTPKPTDFVDFERAKLRSINGLYNTITSGVQETSMSGFASQLSEAQRWDLAFYVGHLFANQAQIAKGKALYLQLNDPSEFTRERLISLAPIEEQGRGVPIDIIAYLRSHPQVLWKPAPEF